MNSNTKEKLIRFADAVETFAHSASSFIGIDACAQVCKASEELKDALKFDETILP